MGYEVHVTRTANCLDDEYSPIPLVEWLGYVATDPELRHDGVAVAHLDNEVTIAYENPGLAVWVAYLGHDETGNMAWIDYQDGQLVVKNPDEEIISKLKQIASYFGARVFGDDGEEY